MAANQLKMAHRNLGGLPEIEVPEGYELRTYLPGDEAAWAEIMNTGVGEWTAETCREKLIGQPQFLPDGLFFATFEGRPIGSACAWRSSADEWEKGYLHMVCVLPEHRGKQIGYVLTLAVLRYFRDHGFKEVWLSTDDHRIPAIKSYLRLGFEPHYEDDSHRARWSAVLEQIATPL
ncbi:MAG: GNAT family N-acetyltransferase [Armatimonadetes bacterium]|nr:GNAT family N-acetyltransferase [Armatimonadota bacterium]